MEEATTMGRFSIAVNKLNENFLSELSTICTINFCVIFIIFYCKDNQIECEYFSVH